MFNNWNVGGDGILVSGMHPHELVFYMHQNMKSLESFEKTYGNILAYRAIWTKATLVRQRINEDVLGQGLISKDQEDAITMSIEQTMSNLLTRLQMTSKVDSDVVRYLTTMLFWEQEFSLGDNSSSFDPVSGTYIITEHDNAEALKDFLKENGEQIWRIEFKLESEKDPRLSEFVNCVQNTYGTFKKFRMKRQPYKYTVDMAIMK